MAKVTAADLKKHHYWILAGVAPLFTLLAALFLSMNVGAEVAKAVDETGKAIKDVEAVRPKGKIALDEQYPKQKEVLAAQKKSLWEVSYERQKSHYGWPPGPRLRDLEKRFTKFGTPMKSDEAFLEFAKPEIYEASYEALAKSIDPTQFLGGWKGVLRHVNNWTQRVPTDKQIWLALEDLWVQRGLLEPINDINAAAGLFIEVKPPPGQKDDPLKRTFQSRVWRLELDVPKQSVNGQRLITAKLTNRTDRLQPLGLDNRMVLKLYLSPTAPATLYTIAAPLVPAGQTIEVRVPTSEKDTPEREKLKAENKLRVYPATSRFNAVPAGLEPTAIVKVVQALDRLNAPVRRIDDVVLGTQAKDNRHHPAELLPPNWYKEAEAGAAAAGGMGGMPPGLGGSAGAGMGGGSPDTGGEGGGRGPGMSMGAPMAAGAKAGTPRQVLDGNRLRYITVTDQVRRMPVALVLVVDQAFVPDVLACYSNSSLRFQVTQYFWKRFRGSLGDNTSTMTGGSPFGPGGPPGMMGGGSPFGGGPAGLGGSGDGAEGTGTGSPGGMGSGSGMFGGSGGGFGGSGGVSDEQVTSGLVELSLYGIVTLYERFDAPKAPDAPAPAPAETPATPPATPTTPPSPAAPTPSTGGKQ